MQKDISRDQRVESNNNTRMENDKRKESCSKIKHDKSTSETAIDSDDEPEGVTIAEKLRANPKDLKIGFQPLGLEDGRKQLVDQALPKQLKRAMLHHREMLKHPQQRRDAKVIMSDDDKAWEVEHDCRVW